MLLMGEAAKGASAKAVPLYQVALVTSSATKLGHGVHGVLHNPTRPFDWIWEPRVAASESCGLVLATTILTPLGNRLSFAHPCNRNRTLRCPSAQRPETHTNQQQTSRKPDTRVSQTCVTPRPTNLQQTRNKPETNLQRTSASISGAKLETGAGPRSTPSRSQGLHSRGA